MPIAAWSARRIWTMWAGGLVLQVLLVLAPVLVARRLIANSGELPRVAAEQDARWRAGDLADSLSLAKQRADSRAARSYTVTAAGDTLFPLVRIPSGRPDPVAVAALGRQHRHSARYIASAILGTIPTILVVITAIWIFARRTQQKASSVRPAPLGAGLTGSSGRSDIERRGSQP